VQLLGSRKDPPKLVVSGAHAINLTVDRARLQAIFTEAGHADLAVPQSLDGAAVAVQLPRAWRRNTALAPRRPPPPTPLRAMSQSL